MNIDIPYSGRLWVSILIILVLSGCSVGPDFLRPFTKAETESKGFINDIYQDKTKHQSMSFWWERIDDPVLNEYVAKLLNDNLQLAEASERIVQAQARKRIAGGANYPSLSADVSGSRSFTGNLGGNFGGSNIFGGGRTYSTTYDVALSSSWQIDLFGKIRRSVEAADASYIASVYDRKALAQSLIAQLLNLRVEIAVNKALLDLSQKSTQNRRDTLDIVERRYEMGAQNTKPQDVLRARHNLESAQADIHQYQRLISDASYRLDVLLGQLPGTTDPYSSKFSLLAPPVDVAACLPADLLDRRPDLQASELRVKAANADIGVAIADLYPSLSLGGSLGFNSDETLNLFSADQLAGSLLASITNRIFEGGALRANIDLQKSEARALAAGYADDVLNAVREVETNLKGEFELGRQLQNAQESVVSLETARNIVQERYMRGIESLRDFLEAEQEFYLAHQNLLVTQQSKWNARIALYLALGGDWFAEGSERMNCQTPQEEQHDKRDVTDG